MTELLRFAMEDWGYFVGLVILIIIVGTVLSMIVDKFKPIQVTYVTQVIQEERLHESNEFSNRSERE